MGANSAEIRAGGIPSAICFLFILVEKYSCLSIELAMQQQMCTRIGAVGWMPVNCIYIKSSSQSADLFWLLCSDMSSSVNRSS